MNRHVNIPIFIPHLGCPNCCVFCNQRTISGVESFDIKAVRAQIDAVLSTVGDADCEIAFFGGSFTGIERCLMISLLELARDYIQDGSAVGIRCSTRPDYIDQEVLDVLKSYGVSTVELGIQSVSDKVLASCRRGHSFADTVSACRLVVENGFNLVGQMMIGLPDSTLDDEIRTAEFIISAGATAARIYPTVVFKQTELCNMAEYGAYDPLTIEDAVVHSARVYEMFLGAGVDVIRVGLCSSENLSSEDKYFAGPNHAALGELVENEIYYNELAKELRSCGDTFGKKYKAFVPKGALSKAIGQRKRNRLRLIKEFELADLRFFEDDSINAFGVVLVQERNEAGCI